MEENLGLNHIPFHNSHCGVKKSGPSSFAKLGPGTKGTTITCKQLPVRSQQYNTRKSSEINVICLLGGYQASYFDISPAVNLLFSKF